MNLRTHLKIFLRNYGMRFPESIVGPNFALYEYDDISPETMIRVYSFILRKAIKSLQAQVDVYEDIERYGNLLRERWEG